VGCFYSFIVARFIGGIGIGISTVAAPLYIAEDCPSGLSRRLGGNVPVQFVFGIIIAFLSNYLLQDIGPNAWRWMLGVAAFPSVFYHIHVLRHPGKSGWLLGRKQDREAGIKGAPAHPARRFRDNRSRLRRTRCSPSHTKRWKPNAFGRRVCAPDPARVPHRVLQPTLRINAILYFGARIFEMTGLAPKRRCSNPSALA